MSHHSPDVLHGPDARTTVPPANPRRSVVTRTGRPLASAATRPGTGWRQRRKDRGWRLGGSELGSPELSSQGLESPRARDCDCAGVVIWRKRLSSQTPRADTSPRSPARPMRSCPITAPSRASSVESCSGVGCGRANSVCCTTRPGVGSMTMVTRSTAAARADAIRDPAAPACAASGRRASATAARGGARARSPRHQPELHVQHGHAAVAALEADRQRLEQPREHERQRLEALDRPLEIHGRLEPLLRQHPARAAGRRRLAPGPATAGPARPSRADRSAGGSAAQLAERPEPPALKRRDRRGSRGLFARSSSLRALRCSALIVVIAIDLFEDARSAAGQSASRFRARRRPR